MITLYSGNNLEKCKGEEKNICYSYARLIPIKSRTNVVMVICLSIHGKSCSQNNYVLGKHIFFFKRQI